MRGRARDPQHGPRSLLCGAPGTGSPHSLLLLLPLLPVARGCCGHNAAQDIVIPVMLLPDLDIHKSPLNPMSGTSSNRTQTFFFAGRICGDRKPPSPNGTCNPFRKDYSADVRHRVGSRMQRMPTCLSAWRHYRVVRWDH